MTPADESRTLRARSADLDSAIARIPADDPSPGATLLVRTVAVTSYPTTAGVAYGVNMLTIDLAAEAEGQVPTLAVVPGVFYALNLGGTVPPVGTNLLVELVGGFWVFRT